METGPDFRYPKPRRMPLFSILSIPAPASAVCILENDIFEDEENAKYAIHYGLSFGDWLRNAYTGTFIATQEIEYADRYIYIDPGYPGGAIYQVPHRLIDRFGSTNRASYFASRFYYPKLTDPINNTIEWTLANHGDYGIAADIKGKNNITLNEDKTHAISWGERIHEQGDASYSFSLTSGGVTITNPFPGNPAGMGHLLPRQIHLADRRDAEREKTAENLFPPVRGRFRNPHDRRLPDRNPQFFLPGRGGCGQLQRELFREFRELLDHGRHRGQEGHVSQKLPHGKRGREFSIRSKPGRRHTGISTPRPMPTTMRRP